jgi:hypothetical protein
VPVLLMVLLGVRDVVGVCVGVPVFVLVWEGVRVLVPVIVPVLEEDLDAVGV